MPLLDAQTQEAPEFPVGADVTWLNCPDPAGMAMARLRGEVVLVDFWDFTCLNCLRTMPYMRAWHDRYAQHGLTIIGVHAPEFEFAGQSGQVSAAMERLGIKYPVVIDRQYAIWKQYANRYWPAKYLIDRDGWIRYYHFGEGQYGNTETVIQALLLERQAGLQLPPIMEPVRPEDKPGGVCFRVTPEIHLGYWRQRCGNPGGLVQDKPHNYADPASHVEGEFYLDGRWLAQRQAVECVEAGAAVVLPFKAAGANLVIAPGGAARAEIEVRIDGQPVRPDFRGADLVCAADGRTVVMADAARMYELLDFRSQLGKGTLTLIARTAGMKLFAFTFSSCVGR